MNGLLVKVSLYFLGRSVKLWLYRIAPKRFTKFIGFAGRCINYLVGNDAQLFVYAFTKMLRAWYRWQFDIGWQLGLRPLGKRQYIENAPVVIAGHDNGFPFF
jgi:hypothetical protein